MTVEKYIVRTDQELVSLSLEGDKVAFDHLFGRYRESMHKIYVQRTGGSHDDAEDLIQDTFLKVYMNLGKYDPVYTFGQWIYTIARNTFIDYLRKRQENVSIENLQRGQSSFPTPEESIINSQQQAQIEMYMKQLRPRYRSLIELRFFRDYSYEEIAKELEIPIGTVKTQLHRAREQMCRLIEENGNY